MTYIDHGHQPVDGDGGREQRRHHGRGAGGDLWRTWTALTAQDGGSASLATGHGELADGGELGAGGVGDGLHPAGDVGGGLPGGDDDADEHRGGDESG